MSHYVLLLENRLTGERRCSPSCGAYDGHDSFWLLTEGSWGCDCNRSVFFGDAEAPCNTGDNQYVLLALLDAAAVPGREDGHAACARPHCGG
jgi:hypothetical protein